MLGSYSVSKTALLGLTKVFAQELANENITVNCIAPGVIKTKFSRAVRIRLSVRFLFALRNEIFAYRESCFQIYESETANEIALSKIPMNR